MQQISYQVIRSRRRSLALEITPQGEVIVRCPARTSQAQIHRFVQSREQWLQKHLHAIAERPVLPKLTEADLTDLRARAATVLPERVRHFAGVLGVDYGRITIRAQKTRWGSCSAEGNLSFNCLLMLMPPEIADYVVVHELCHRKEMNHSSRFWAEVEAALPDCRVSRKWLKENGPALIERI